MRHIKLFESFDESQVWYHGAKHKDKDFVEAMKHVGAAEANDEEGPGIYLTSMEDDARKYGAYVYKIKLNPTGRIITEKDKLSSKDVNIAKNIIKKYCDDWEMTAQNFDENPNVGLSQFLHGVQLDATDTKDFYQSVWYDFFRHQGPEFVKGMSANGIDAVITGAYHKHGNGLHAIVYNPVIIEVIKLIER